jgi:ABC-type lipoprotein release transport system permease subunit
LSFTLLVAKRYFFSKRKQHAVNIITRISVAGIMTGTAGLVIVLSVFNGFSNLVSNLYDAFDPDIKIVPASGKFFPVNDIDLHAVSKTNGIKAVSFSLEESVLVKYNEKQAVAVLKGVDSSFDRVSEMSDYLIDGNWSSADQQTDAAIGAGLAYVLGLTPEDLFHHLQFFFPDKDVNHTLTPEEAFRTGQAKATGVFQIQQEFDNSFVIVPLDFIQELTGNEQKASSLEVALDENADLNRVKEQLSVITGNTFKTLDRKEQHVFLFKIFRSEKFAIYLILGFILLLSSFGIIGSLSMLMIEKKNDIKTMQFLGADVNSLRKIFLLDGILLTAAGLLAGLILGSLICKAQQHFELIKLGHSGDFVVDAYPVALQVSDLLLISCIVMGIGILLSRYIVNRMINGM